jgi:hypothetical protein
VGDILFPDMTGPSMSQRSIIDFLPELTSKPDRCGDVWGEAGRAIEAGNRAPAPIDLALRLAIVIALTLPLLSRLAEGGLLILLRSSMQPFLVWP